MEAVQAEEQGCQGGEEGLVWGRRSHVGTFIIIELE
jgi:hypothetical protein